MNPELDPLLEDALSEVLNLGVGRAASALNELVGQEVQLSVPEARILKIADVESFLGQDLRGADLSSVRMNISGELEGSAFLLFPNANSLELVRCFVGEDTPLEALEDLEREALLEVGNLVLNACLGTVGDTLGSDIATGLPSFVRGTVSEGILNWGGDRAASGVFMKVRFDVQELAVTGFIALVMGVRSLEALKDALQRFVTALQSPPS